MEDHPDFDPVRALRFEVDELKAENDDLREWVRAFGICWATHFAATRDLPPSHLADVHYDILEKCGVRMDGFVRNPQR